MSLASCCFKVFEHLIHARIAPNRQLSESQGGFRWGADALVGSLVNLLTMRASTNTLSPLLTSRKRSTLRGWKRRWSDCTTLESEDSSGTCCPISSAAQCRKFDWAMSCRISGWMLKGGSCPHSFFISSEVQLASPGVQCQFTDQVYADDLVLVADSSLDLHFSPP